MSVRCIAGLSAHPATVTATFDPCGHTAPYCIPHAWRATDRAHRGRLVCALPPHNPVLALRQSPLMPAAAYSIRPQIESSADVVRNRVSVTAGLFSVAMVLAGFLGGPRHP